jgi:hypothetical protein
MKKLLLAATIALLSSCSLIDAYRMARFDNNEYMMVNRIQTQAQLGVERCGTNQAANTANDIWFKSVELKNYSASRLRNQETITMTVALEEITRGLKDRYAGTDPVSTAYCKIKLNTIEKNATTIQAVIGARPR